jgi:hypothetical protein
MDAFNTMKKTYRKLDSIENPTNKELLKKKVLKAKIDRHEANSDAKQARAYGNKGNDYYQQLGKPAIDNMASSEAQAKKSKDEAFKEKRRQLKEMKKAKSK